MSAATVALAALLLAACACAQLTPDERNKLHDLYERLGCPEADCPRTSAVCAPPATCVEGAVTRLVFDSLFSSVRVAPRPGALERIGVFRNLIELSLANLGLNGTFPELSLGGLTALDLSGNAFDDIRHVSGLSNLRRLEARDMATRDVMFDPAQLTNLELLDMALDSPEDDDDGSRLRPHTRATWVNELLASATALTSLDLSGHVIDDGELEFPLRALALEELSCRACQLNGTLPVTILEAANLQKLDLSANTLFGDIPFSLTDMPRLTTLYLNGNYLTGDVAEFENVDDCDLLDIGAIAATNCFSACGRLCCILESRMESECIADAQRLGIRGAPQPTEPADSTAGVFGAPTTAASPPADTPADQPPSSAGPLLLVVVSIAVATLVICVCGALVLYLLKQNAAATKAARSASGGGSVEMVAELGYTTPASKGSSQYAGASVDLSTSNYGSPSLGDPPSDYADLQGKRDPRGEYVVGDIET